MRRKPWHRTIKRKRMLRSRIAIRFTRGALHVVFSDTDAARVIPSDCVPWLFKRRPVTPRSTTSIGLQVSAETNRRPHAIRSATERPCKCVPYHQRSSRAQKRIDIDPAAPISSLRDLVRFLRRAALKHPRQWFLKCSRQLLFR